MRRSRLLALLAVVFLLFAACGDDDEGGDGTDDEAAAGEAECRQAPLPDDDDDGDDEGEAGEGGAATTTTSGGAAGGEARLQDDGTLTVGSNVAYAPFEFLEAGQPTGFDIELITEIAKRMDLEVSIQNDPSFDALIPKLIDGQYDVVISAMTITDARAEQISFSDPYFDSDQSFTINVEEDPGLTPETLEEGMVIGVERGTTGAAYAEENCDGVEIRIFDNTEQSLGDLANGRVDAVINDFPVSAFATQGQFEGILEVVTVFRTGEQYGIGVAKDNPALLAQVDEALAEVREDGTYDRIFEKWFGDKPEE
jgi:ABC-type amino acid transport substrate-binding protein